MLSKNYKYIYYLKIILLIICLFFTIFLIYFQSNQQNTNEKNIIFMLDLSKTMNTQDIIYKNQMPISRLQTSKYLIQKIIQTYPNYNYWLIVFSNYSDYFLPATQDTWTFLQYLNWITTNQSWRNSDLNLPLNEIEKINSDFYFILLSDFSNLNFNKAKLLKPTNKINIIVVSSKNWWLVRYPNGNIFRQNWKTITSKYDKNIVNSVSKTLHSKYYISSSIEKWDEILSKIFSFQNIKISDTKINIALFLLWFLIIIWL